MPIAATGGRATHAHYWTYSLCHDKVINYMTGDNVRASLYPIRNRQVSKIASPDHEWYIKSIDSSVLEPVHGDSSVWNSLG